MEDSEKCNYRILQNDESILSNMALWQFSMCCSNKACVYILFPAFKEKKILFNQSQFFH